MPTKPAAIVVRASDLNYSTGPAILNGTVTKISTVDALTREGYRVDSPLGTFPVPAQAINFFNNQTDLWIDDWVFLGTSANDQDAHLIETDSTGETNIASVVAGSTTSNADAIRTDPNSGTSETGLFVSSSLLKSGAIFETIGDDDISAAIFRATVAVTGGVTNPGIIRVESLSNGPTCIAIESASVVATMKVNNTAANASGIEVQAGPGDSVLVLNGGPAFFGLQGAPDAPQTGGLAGRFRGDQTTGDVVLIEQINATGAGVGLVVTHAGQGEAVNFSKTNGRSPTLILTSSEAGAGEAAAPLVLTPQSFDPQGQGIEEGSIWIRSDTLTGSVSGDPQFHPRFTADTNQARWSCWTDHPTCSIDAINIATVPGPASDSFFLVIQSSFPGKMIPVVAGGKVIVTFKGRVRRSADDSTILAKDGTTFKIVDSTATVTIIEEDFDLPALDVSGPNNTLDTYVELEFIYTVPLAGARTFQVSAQRQNGAFIGGITVTNPYFRLRPLAAGEDVPS